MDVKTVGKLLEEKDLLFVRESKALDQAIYRVKEGDSFVAICKEREGISLYLSPTQYDLDNWHYFGLQEILSEEDLAEGVSLTVESAKQLAKVAAFNELLAEKEEEE